MNLSYRNQYFVRERIKQYKTLKGKDRFPMISLTKKCFVYYVDLIVSKKTFCWNEYSMTRSSATAVTPFFTVYSDVTMCLMRKLLT